MVDRPIYGEVIVTAKERYSLPEDDTDRERGGNETKTRLSTNNDTRPSGVLAPPYIGEVFAYLLHVRSSLLPGPNLAGGRPGKKVKVAQTRLPSVVFRS